MIKNQRKAVVLGMLDELAHYVQGACLGDLAVLLSSGFRATSQNRTRAPLPQPEVKRLRHGMTGESVLALHPIPNARSYELQVAEVMEDNAAGPWVLKGVFTNSQRLVAAGLSPGKVYIFQARAVGGSAGYSDWSDPVSHRAM